MIAAPSSGARAAWPLAALCCLGVIGFLLAATIILALIPIYLPTKQTSSSTTTDTSPFYVAYSGSSTSLTSDNNLPGSVQNSDKVGSSLGVGSLGQVQSGQTQPTTTRRRRGVLNQRDKRDLGTTILLKCATIFAATCTTTTCRTAAINSFKAKLNNSFSSIPITVNVSSTQNTTFSYNLVFVGFYNETTKPIAGSVVASSTNFTVSQSGLFSNTSTWSGGIVPYGNCTVIIPSGYTLTIAGSTLQIRVITFYVNGTLAIGQNSSTFTFTYATTIIIQSGGTLLDLTTSKTITLAQESYLTTLTGGTVSTSTLVVGGSSRSQGDKIVISKSSGPYTCGVYSTTLYDFTKVAFMCRRRGLFLQPSTYLGSYAPSAAVCNTSNSCEVFVGPGATLLTDDLNGVLNINIDTFYVASGGNLSLGTAGVDNFTFPSAVTIEAFGLVQFAGRGGSIRTPIGSFLNVYSTGGLSSPSSVSLQAFNPATNGDVGPPRVLGTSFIGPQYLVIPTNGIIYVGTSPGGSGTTTTTAMSVTGLIGS